MPGAAVVDREVLGEDHDRALRRVVRAAARGAFESFDARDRDDAAALAVDRLLFEHVRDRVLRAQERAGEVDVEHALPFVALEQVRRAAARDAGRGDDRVDATVLGDHARRSRAAIASSSRTSACANVDLGRAAPGGRARSAAR